MYLEIIINENPVNYDNFLGFSSISETENIP